MGPFKLHVRCQLVSSAFPSQSGVSLPLSLRREYSTEAGASSGTFLNWSAPCFTSSRLLMLPCALQMQTFLAEAPSFPPRTAVDETQLPFRKRAPEGRLGAMRFQRHVFLNATDVKKRLLASFFWFNCRSGSFPLIYYL